MIPFASQRGSGQDLATHLLNEYDNEYMELADLRGAIADDLHGAFAEWEAEATAMTKCANYLYSLSVNPDPAQGPMSRELYQDYIDRVETALGLDGQPRAVVFHIKEDKAGISREHAHVVWSRIDVQEMKAVHMAFDHDKLMTVTRQFARDHDIQLAPGYYDLEARKRQTYRQLSLYEKAQQDSLGLAREERRATITELWQGRDTPASFIKALEHHGYILATGKRPFVLVDIHGHINSLPKLIDDKAVNTKAIREFLGEEYTEENLPAVEDAVEAAAEHRRTLKAFKQSERRADKIDELKLQQAKRREKAEQEFASFLEQQKRDRIRLQTRHRTERDTHRREYLDQTKEIRRDREEHKPQGLAGFLSRVTGMDQVRHKLHRYQDKKRYDAYLEQKHDTRDRQDEERLVHQRAQQMQALDMERKTRALENTEKRELQSLELSFEKRQAVQYRSGHEHMPSLQLELSPPGRKAVPHKAKARFTSEVGRELWPARKVRTRDPEAKENTVHDEFNRTVRKEPDPENGRNVSTAIPLKPNLVLKDAERLPKPTDTPPALKPKDDRKERHIDSANRAFNRNQERPDPRSDEKLQSSEPSTPISALEVDQRDAEPVPNPEDAMQRTFDEAASGSKGPDNADDNRSEQAEPRPTAPERSEPTYRPEPPENEPDRER